MYQYPFKSSLIFLLLILPLYSSENIYTTVEVENYFSQNIMKDVSLSLNLSDDNTSIQQSTNVQGLSHLTLEQDKMYTINATKDGFLNVCQTIFTPPKTKSSHAYLKKIRMSPTKGSVYRLDDVLYQFDKAVLTDNDKIQLDKILLLMQKFPELIIELQSHTDSRGSDSYNQDLSNRRALSVQNYVINAGIDGQRVTSFGFGESQLLNNCSDGVVCSSQQHKINRRTIGIVRVDAKRLLKTRPTIIPIKKNISFHLKNVYFDLDKYDILEPGKKDLQRLVSLMQHCNSVKIELSSHTDSRADDDYNKVLSTKRALSSKQFLLNSGIDSARILAIGYGETHLINDCGNDSNCSKEQHHKNRRTEVLILDAGTSKCRMIQSPDGRSFVVMDNFDVCPLGILID